MKPNRTLALLLVLLLVLPTGSSQGAAVNLASAVRVYIYRPDVFADRSLGPGLPASPSVLQSYLWYLRMDESVRSLARMDGLAGFVRSRGVPGLDFSGHRTLTNSDLETLFRPDVWKTSPSDPTYKFRLLKLTGTQTDDRSLPVIGQLFDLQVLALSDRVSDRGMKFLAPLKQLRVLSAPSPLITDESLDVLAQLPKLQRLSLVGSQVSDAGLKRFAGLPLRQLDLGPTTTDRGLQNLRAVRTLEQLNLHASRVSGDGLRALADLPGIHTLFLGPSISDADLPALAKFKNLQRLDLTGARLTDASLEALTQMTRLEELALTDTSVTGKAMAVLSRLPKLRYLEISGTRVTPAAFKNVAGFPSLQVVSFSSTQRLHASDIKPLARLPRLHSVLVNRRVLGPKLIDVLRKESLSRSGWDWLVPLAEAAGASENEVEDILEVANLPAEKAKPPYPEVGGLPLIHESEVSLDEVIAAPTMIGQDNQQETEKNFLGEFTVGVDSPKKKKK